MWFTRPVFIRNSRLVEASDESFYRRHMKTKVAVLVVAGGRCGTADQVKVTLSAYGKPGMPSIMKRFGNGIQLKDVVVKAGAH